MDKDKALARKGESRLFLLPSYRLANIGQDDKLDLPESEVERYELPAHVAGWVLYILLAMILCGLLWAAWAQVDVVAEAPGKVIPQGDVKVIAPSGDGIVEQILVKEGQQVRQGDSLLVLDAVPYASDVAKLTKELEINDAETAQHKAAVIALTAATAHPDKLPEIPVKIADVSQIMSSLHDSFTSFHEQSGDYSLTASMEQSPERLTLSKRLDDMLAEKASRTKSLTSRRLELHEAEIGKSAELHEKKAELENSKLELNKLESILAKSRQQESSYKSVFEQGAVSLVDYLNIQKQVVESEREIIKQQSHIDDLKHQIKIETSALNQLKSKSKADASQLEGELKRLSSDVGTVRIQIRDSERKKIIAQSAYEGALSRAQACLAKEQDEVSQHDRQHSKIAAQLDSAKHILDQAVLKSGTDGTVTAITTKGKGEIVRRGQQLMTLVPANSSLLIEARVSNKDIGFVEKGQRAKLKLAAFPFQDYGVIEGTVSEVEVHPKQEPEKDKESFYLVRVIPSRTWIKAKGRKVPFVSGMEVTTEIVLRRRSVLVMMIDPLKTLADTKWN
jgi:HlyD family secretion protein